MIFILTLRELNPEAAEMWAYDLNDPIITPDNIAGRSDKIAFFRCLANSKHVFKKRVGKMTSDDGNSYGCIYCSDNAKRVFPGETDLLSKCPEARDMWDYDKNKDINPANVLPKSSKKAFFKCNKGHSTYRKIQDFYRSPKCTICEHEKTKLIYNFPNTSLFWNNQKNINIDMNEIGKSANTIIDLKCPNCKYDWNEKARTWFNRRFCPCCGFDGTKESIKKNSTYIKKHPKITFRMANPQDAEMWCYDLNGDKTPDNVLYTSKIQAYFMCKNGHKFKTSIANMTISKGKSRGCLYCKNTSIKAYTGENDLFTLCPEAKEMWDFDKNKKINPEVLIPTSPVKAYFKCSFGHESYVSVSSFYKNPICKKCNIIQSKSIVAKRPDALVYWDYSRNTLSPEEVTPFSNEEAYWKCQRCGYEWKAIIANRLTSLKNKCPSCDLRRVYNKSQDKAITFRTQKPEAAKLWIDDMNNGITPDNVAPKSGKTVYLKCENNPEHIYSKHIYEIPNKKPYGCPYCQKRRTVAFPGTDDVFTICPTSKEMWDWEKNKELDPYHLLPGSRTSAWFICENDHNFKKRILEFVESPSCPVCKKIKYSISSYPHLIKQWHFEKNKGIDVNLMPASTKKTVWWKCKKCGYEWEAQICSRRLSKGLCPCCETRIIVKAGITDLFSMVPDLKADYDFSKNTNINPDKLYVSDSTKVWWKCNKCGYEWKASPTSRLISRENNYEIKECSACAGTIRTKPYVELYPDLRKRFNERKNGFPVEELQSSMLTQNLYWTCDVCKKNFTTTLATMIRSYSSKFHGCSYCSRTIIPREESFGFLYPVLMKEYDPENTVDAYEYSPISPKIVKWICKNNPNHKWEASFIKRKGSYGGCPECELTERLLLINVRPDLEEYYDLSKNDIPFSSITYMSNKKFWWKCKMNHSFNYRVYSLSKYDSFYCPICNNVLLESGFNDFATKYPEFVQYFDKDKNMFSPYEIRFNSKTSIWWTCDNGHSYQQTIYNRIQNKNCSVCSRSIVIPGTNDFLSSNPGIEKIWGPDNDKKPEEYSDITSAEMDFLCEKGHHYKTFAYRIRTNGTQCLVCQNIVFLPGVNSFADKYPELLDEWSDANEIKPTEIICNSSTNVKWICPTCHGLYEHQINERSKGDMCCPYCNNNLVKADFNSFAAKAPKELVAQWSLDNKKRPTEVLYPTGKYYKRLCIKCNNSYPQKLSDWKIDDNSCPYCNDKETLAGFNSLLDTHKELVKEWSNNNELAPDKYRKSTTYYVLWICPTCHGEYSARICDREVGDNSCPYCKGKKALTGFNTFKTKHPDLMKTWDYINNYILLDPDTILDKCDYLVWWNCDKDPSHKYLMSPKRRIQNQIRHIECCKVCKGYRRKKHHYI
ncbi:zinc-ribbon domain-containing protein [Anaerosporobacter faecicola]|uniref:zinc-ribbon domain-containing protein n=1 Tax=Anaerosporobacter faecicola TaxID=2718714 RepID=UPI00143BBC37|nr:zinc-ribbon domain-containing protein [Anaerosporobacter faecicola]